MTALHLIADTEQEAAVLSALVQDAILSSADVRRDARLGNVALLLSRFRWEDRTTTSRVRCLLVIRGVTAATRLRWPAEPQPLELLALRHGDGAMRLDFAGGPALRLAVSEIRIALEDVGDSWRVRRAPRHES